jgi:hypothetical protein
MFQLVLPWYSVKDALILGRTKGVAVPHSRMQTSLRFWQCLTNEHRHARVCSPKRTIARFGCFSWLCSEWVASNRITAGVFMSCHW